jgi:lipid A disaccharide synthetase
VVGELLPLKCLVIVDINLAEKFDKLLDKLGLVGVFGAKMVEHDLKELLETQAIILALVEILLDFLKLAVVEITHDVLILLVPVLIRIVLPVYECQ